jgi:hypothetical protein
MTQTVSDTTECNDILHNGLTERVGPNERLSGSGAKTGSPEGGTPPGCMAPVAFSLRAFW